MSSAERGPTASDGSVHPDRALPTFERDLQRMFASISDRYEAFNHAATFGQDLLWRPRAVWTLARAATGPVREVLDVGCGTGELARLLGRRFPRARVVAVDFTREMVLRAGAASGRRSPGLAVATATGLPFPDGAFDVAASAFLLRNLPDPLLAFRELRRVLRAGGTLLTLEVSEPSSPIVARIFHAHFDHAVPILGRAFAREGPYRYLPESLRTLPPPSRLVELFAEADFPETRVVPMSLGIVRAYLSRASGGADARR